VRHKLQQYKDNAVKTRHAVITTLPRAIVYCGTFECNCKAALLQQSIAASIKAHACPLWIGTENCNTFAPSTLASKFSLLQYRASMAVSSNYQRTLTWKGFQNCLGQCTVVADVSQDPAPWFQLLCHLFPDFHLSTTPCWTQVLQTGTCIKQKVSV